MQGLQALEEAVELLELPLALRELCGETKEEALPTLNGDPKSVPPAFLPPPPAAREILTPNHEPTEVPSSHPGSGPTPSPLSPHHTFPLQLPLSGAHSVCTPLPRANITALLQEPDSPRAPLPAPLPPALAPAASLSRGLALCLACPGARSPATPWRTGTPRTGLEGGAPISVEAEARRYANIFSLLWLLMPAEPGRVGPTHRDVVPGAPHHASSGPGHHCPSAKKTPSPEVPPQAEPRH